VEGALLTPGERVCLVGHRGLVAKEKAHTH
jgi:hypothetical protein